MIVLTGIYIFRVLGPGGGVPSFWRNIQFLEVVGDKIDLDLVAIEMTILI